MFYTFRQNNSGGHFDYDARRGIAQYVIIEADNVDSALSDAGGIGLYFDGEGDCPCCGDRWSDYVSESDADTEPSIYGTPVDDFVNGEQSRFSKMFLEKDDQFLAFVHYKDGRVVGK